MTCLAGLTVAAGTVSARGLLQTGPVDEAPAAAAVAVAPAATFDCKKGCPAITSPVCAEGGITLQSACLAFCQQLPLKHNGACVAADDTGATHEDAVAG